MIVDEADTDIAMAEDPFLEAGINIPEELPYQPTPQVAKKLRRSIASIPKSLHTFEKQTSITGANQSPTMNRLASFRKKFLTRGESFRLQGVKKRMDPHRSSCMKAGGM